MTAADLSPVDRAVLEQLLAGRTSKQIAQEAGNCRQGISQRLTRIKRLIGVRTIIQLGAWCERHGIREAGQG